MKPQRAIFLSIFVLLGIVFFKIPLSSVLGLNFSFSLMNGFGPAAGAVIGSVTGFALIFIVRILGILLGIFNFTTIPMFFSILPMAASSLYFGSKRKETNFIGIFCMILFVAHPIGRQVWYFSLFWLIPLLPLISRRFSLISRSLGATFTDHAVGSVFWLYAVNVPAEMWVAAISLVPFERSVFALGIAITYSVMVWMLKTLDNVFQAQWNFSLFKEAEVVPLELKLK